MAYTKYVYMRTNWKNKSESLETPIGKTNLNHIESGIYNIAENLDVVYNELDSKKFNKADANKVITGMPTWNPNTGILVFRFYDGTEFSVDFNIEKIPVSFSMDSAGVITMTTADGTQWTADIGDVIPTYTFVDSDTIALTDTKNGDYEHTVSAEVRAGSIKEKHLQPNYLADIKVQASNAAASANAASGYADDAAYDAKLSQSYAIGGSGIRSVEDTDNSKYYKEQANGFASSASASASAAAASANTASQKATDAANSQSAAATSEANTKTSETNAKASETASKTSETNAKTSETNAKASETVAAQYASTASQKATDASNSATAAQNYATGSTNSSKYYYEQSKSISESLSGALRPMGTVAFASLPSLSSATEGDMYNISDKFTTTADFKEGAGNVIPAGANVYKTADGRWDVLAGTPVTSVNGQRGDVSITPNNIGALPVNGTATKATQDGNGNNIVNTYAKKSIYGDTAINLGRKSGSTVGVNSTAEGDHTIASGQASHAGGIGTIASQKAQHVIGMYNEADGMMPHSFIIGGGSSDSSRKNIHTVDWSGNAEYAGDVTGHDSSGHAISLSWLNGSLAELNQGLSKRLAWKNAGNCTGSGSVDISKITFQELAVLAIVSTDYICHEYCVPAEHLWENGTGRFRVFRQGFYMTASDNSYAAIKITERKKVEIYAAIQDLVDRKATTSIFVYYR